MAYEVARDAARQASGEQWPGGISATMEAKLGRIKNYRRALTTSEKELKELRATVAENAKTLRQTEVFRRSADDSAKRLQKLSRDHAKAVSELTSSRLLVSQAEAAHEELLGTVQQAQREQEAALASAKAQEAEVESLREQLAALEFERRKDQVVLRMAPRLQSSAEKLRTHLMGRSRANNAPRSSGRGSGAMTAPDALLALEKELTTHGKSPKAMILLNKAKQAADALETARQDGAEREDELLQMLVETVPAEGSVAGTSSVAGTPSGGPPALQAVSVRRG